jgi:hypothetical protein
MPRPVVPVKCKEMRTMNVNITQTTEEEIKTHMEEQYKKFCSESSEIKKKQDEFLSYIYENGYTKFNSWRTKTPKRYEWEEWAGSKISYYNEMIMKHFDYKYDLKLYLESFNKDLVDIECDPLYFDVHFKHHYEISVPDEFKFLESARYKEAKAKWEIEDATWINERNEKRTHDSKHHSVEYHEEMIKKLELNYGPCREHYIQRDGINGALVSTEDATCKYCIIEKIKREREPELKRLQEERERLEEERQEESYRKWQEQKDLEKQNRELYECDLCHFKTYNDTEYEKHEESKEHKKMEELRKFYCSDCNIQTRNQMELNIHKQTMKHKIKIGEIEKQTDFKCEVCNYETKIKQNWDKHILTKLHISNSKK